MVPVTAVDLYIHVCVHVYVYVYKYAYVCACIENGTHQFQAPGTEVYTCMCV